MNYMIVVHYYSMKQYRIIDRINLFKQSHKKINRRFYQAILNIIEVKMFTFKKYF
jgi:hypothetical protein